MAEIDKEEVLDNKEETTVQMAPPPPKIVYCAGNRVFKNIIKIICA